MVPDGPEAAPPELDDYDYELPSDCIAQHPPEDRDGGRLLVLERATGATQPSHVLDLPRWLDAGDLLVLNATRVLPARLRGHKSSGGSAEALVLGPVEAEPDQYRALVRASGRLRGGQKYRFTGRGACIEAELVALEPDGVALLRFEPGASPYAVGETPLPPYIRRDAADPDDVHRYQTTFARVPGSVAAPTAGLHLSGSLIAALAARGVESAEVVLHVGAGTFRPVQARDLTARRLHPERYELPEETAHAIDRTRERGGRIVAVGTTSARVLETCATHERRVAPRRGETDLFLLPGSRFQVVDALLTNFHLPRSSLLLLVAAFAGREAVLRAYREAIAAGFRFYSYGDAMLIR
jgi:S-adenosylmethionine:tRNA ribosyltransferase-isomerase